MNVTFDKQGNVNGVLSIAITQEDYQAEVKKKLAELGRKHPVKGFRPGHVPASLLKKMYGEEVLAQVVERQVGSALSSYIVDNKLDVLGEPMLANDTKFDFSKDTDFEFKFEMGLTPEFDIKLDKRVKIPYYTIEVSQDMIDSQIASLKKRYGKQVAGETVNEDALVKGEMVELDADGAPKADGLKVEKAIFSPRYLKNEDEKAKFVDAKLGDMVVYNPFKATDGNLTELASLLNVDKEQANIESDFQFLIHEILVNQDAEMNQDFFDDVLGKDVAKSEEEFIEKVKDMLANQLKNDSNYRFTVDAERVLCKKVGNLELPDEFLKRFLVARSKEENPEQHVEENYEKTRAQIQWQLIKERVARNFELKVEEDDLLRFARFYAAQQFAQYGMSNLPDDVIERYAKDLLQKDDVKSDIQNRAFEDKVFAAIQSAVTMDEKKVTVDEFNKLFESGK
ncbi:MAG: trigger factor [bacterium]|nr:trigger factor [bacterium]MDD6900247.1 trigger factor [bacterium]